MTPEEWSRIKHFTAQENWGDPARMNFKLLSALDDLREKVATPIFISCGTQGAHVGHSQHYLGNAADILFPEKSLADLMGLWNIALSMPNFTGLGLYADWKYQSKEIGGLHLDVRDGDRKTWLGVMDRGKRLYLPVNRITLKTWGFT